MNLCSSIPEQSEPNCTSTVCELFQLGARLCIYNFPSHLTENVIKTGSIIPFGMCIIVYKFRGALISRGVYGMAFLCIGKYLACYNFSYLCFLFHTFFWLCVFLT